MSATVIARHSTMGEVLEAYPSTQRALFQRYHIGGCNSCGYQHGETLEEVGHHHNIFDAGEVIAFVEQAEQIDRSLGVSPGEVSLDAASYYAGHGSTEVRSMTGGLDALTAEVDPSVPRNGPPRDPSDEEASLRPLRSVVSEADGCQRSEGA